MRVIVAVFLVALVGCPSSEPEVCTSGTFWTGGNSESPLMRPGMDCMGCHQREGEGPSYAVAGTVFTAYDESDDCNGESGVTVEIIDDNGDVTTLSTNAAGNFFLPTSQSTLVFPITARVVTTDGTTEMATKQTSGACNVCHAEVPTGAAPGRIIIP